MIRSLVIYLGAALAEIAGCFAFWAWLRLDRSAARLLPGLALVALFAILPTWIDSAAAGRAYAAYGGVISPPRSPGFGWRKAFARIVGI